ncbi:glutaredoxin family protein [Calothrix sp. PCC 6303]|uniref:glutaredoxin family protein n=1 Tax=Calothrix sp. PCC 6303 TaxID=1170562 RepID=UPI0002A03DA3|nr:glutaredoxin family protein [Calothrix sp. PCC 6303]AFZ01924.1 glutaredoxin 2 [Calothrix sp. PCC 6303]
MRLILYSKPGCHLCEGLQQKLEQITTIQFELEIRDITTQDNWFAMYQYEIPVLMVQNYGNSDDTTTREQSIPRPSPRATVAQLEKLLQKYL